METSNKTQEHSARSGGHATVSNLSVESSHTPQGQQLSLSWSNINAWVTTASPTGQKQRQLIKNVSGIAKPGQLLAIMGASGAGKTSLLNIISGRLSNYRSAVASEGAPFIEGAVEMNGRSVSHRVDILRRFAAFVEQDDVFPGFLTVEEHLWFHAKLRMTRAGTTDGQRKRRIAALMAELNLTKVASTLIGVPELGMKTLSGGERKRLSVATELIANPPLLLLDEPTSGLDSFTSESVILALRQLAQVGKTVAFTIHQPSSELFGYFDRLLLLADGRVCYHGDSKDAAKFFAEAPLNRPCPISYNPADFYIDILSRPYTFAEHINNAQLDDVQAMEVHAKFINKAFEDSRFGRTLQIELKKLTDEARKTSAVIEDFTSSNNYGSLIQPLPNGWVQLKWSTWRSGLSFYRSPQWMRIRVIEMILFSLFYGLVFFQLSDSPVGVMNRCGLLAQLVSLCCWDNLDAYALTIPHDRPFLLRDHSAGLYSLSAYFFGRQFVELPLLFLLTTVQTAVISAMANLWSLTTVYGAFQMMLATFLTGLNASSFGYLIGFMSDNLAVQITFRRIILSLLVLLNGFFLNISTVPVYLVWLIYSSFFFWATEALFLAEWLNVKSLPCPESSSDENFSRCFPDGRAVLDNYAYGDEFRLIIDFVVLIGMVIILRAAALFCLYYRSYGSIWLGMIKARLRKRSNQRPTPQQQQQGVGFSPQSISTQRDNQ